MRIGSEYRVTRGNITFFFTITNGFQLQQGSPAAALAWQFGWEVGSFTVAPWS
jgi:hypothetical protein